MYTVRMFMKCMHVCSAQKAYLLFTKLYIEPDFPSLADEIAERTNVHTCIIKSMICLHPSITSIVKFD